MRFRDMVLVGLLAPVAVAAHVTVWPRQATQGAYEKYVVRVPNEKPVATVRVEARFPAEVRVISFQDVPGWTIEIARDASGRVTGATWAGALPAERFVEFPLIAVNPKRETALSWTFTQVYRDGTRVDWAGAAGSKTPASVVTLVAAGAGAGHH